MTQKQLPDEPKEAPPPPSLIVSAWSHFFYFLSRISVFELLRVAVPAWRNSYVFVEWYVTAVTALSVAALLVAANRIEVSVTWILAAAVAFGAFRIFEVVVYQVNVLLFDEYRSRTSNGEYALRSYRRLVILLVHNYFEIVCWFGVIYSYFIRSGLIKFPSDEHPSVFQIFRESMLLTFAFNPHLYEPVTDWAVFAFSAQAAIGVFLTIVMFARFIALLPPPPTMDPHERDRR
jgi:hypothetical protein